MKVEQLKQAIKEAILEALRERDRELAEMAARAQEEMRKKLDAAGQQEQA